MGFVRQHWFGFIVTLVLLLSALLFLIVLFSPRQDNQKRGFIPCTETMAAALYDCRGRSFCIGKQPLRRGSGAYRSGRLG
mgnify:CR=1 FL=1